MGSPVVNESVLTLTNGYLYTKNTITGTCTWEAKAKTSVFMSTSDAIEISMHGGSYVRASRTFFAGNSSFVGKYANFNGSYVTSNIIGWSANEWHLWRLIKGSTSAKWAVDRANEVEITSQYTVPNGSEQIWL